MTEYGGQVQRWGCTDDDEQERGRGDAVMQDEAYVVSFGMKLAFEAGFRKVDVEMDCLGLLSMLKAN